MGSGWRHLGGGRLTRDFGDLRSLANAPGAWSTTSNVQLSNKASFTDLPTTSGFLISTEGVISVTENSIRELVGYSRAQIYVEAERWYDPLGFMGCNPPMVQGKLGSRAHDPCRANRDKDSRTFLPPPHHLSLAIAILW